MILYEIFLPEWTCPTGNDQIHWKILLAFEQDCEYLKCKEIAEKENNFKSNDPDHLLCLLYIIFSRVVHLKSSAKELFNLTKSEVISSAFSISKEDFKFLWY